MKKSIFILSLMTCILVLIWSSAAEASSLWTDQSSSLYAIKPHIFQVGDLLTIVIEEQSTASQQADTGVSKTGSITNGPGTGLLTNLLPLIGDKWDSDSTGKGSTDRQGVLKAEITVTVKEINPNGSLSFEGHQVIKVNKGEQVMTISGTVRPEDVGSDNTVHSCNIADSSIDFQGNGTTEETQDTGALTKFFHWLF